MSVPSNIADILRNASMRLCRLRVWSNYEGLGFSLEPEPSPPHLVGVVSSNSPAAAAGLKMRDIIFAVNNQDVSKADHNQITDAIRNARDGSGSVELLVVEQRFYETLRKINVAMNATAAKIIDGPRTMPADYVYFPQHQPRTCIIHLNKIDVTLGFDVVNGRNDIGLLVQEILPNSAASRTLLRKCDRIIVIDDEFVDDHESESIIEKLGQVKINGSIKLYVMDTETYKYYTTNKLLLSSKNLRETQSENKLAKVNDKDSDYVKSSTLNMNKTTRTQSLAPADLKKRETSSTPPLRKQAASSSVFFLPQPTLYRADIRLCTIMRADATDPPGVIMNYHQKEQFHFLNIIRGRNNGPSNAELAGVKANDRLIEINGENIEKYDYEQVRQRFQAIKYPEPLQVLVVDTATYEYYKNQDKLIHRKLPHARMLPANMPNQCLPPPRPTDPKPSSFQNSLKPKTSLIQPRIISIRKDSQLLNNIGFHFRTIQNDSSSNVTYKHIITSVENNPLIDLSNLHVNDNILSINNENMEYINHEQLKDKLRRIPTNETILLLVSEETNDRSNLRNSKIKKDNIDQSKSNQRRYRLQRNPKFEDYGFRVRSSIQLNQTSHQIISIQSNSPADVKGLSIGDYIVRVNNQSVRKMNSNEFDHLIKNNNTPDGILLLEVMNEDTYRSSYDLSSTDQSLVFTPLTNSQSSDSKTSDSLTMDKQSYPRMRLCTIRSWSHYKDLGFHIIQSSNTSESNNGYQIQKVRLDSPAAYTQISNDDHLIEVNEINVERVNLQYVNQLIIDSYRRDGKVHLLVIEDIGYQWYKHNQIEIDPSSTKANIIRHMTSDYSSILTSVDSSNASGSADSVSKKSNQNDNRMSLKNHSQMSLTSPSFDNEESTKTNQRFFDMQNEPKVMLLPIEGYENVPLVSLAAAVDNLEYIVPKLKRNAWIAKERSTNPFDDLTVDESAAIQLYTMEWKPTDQSFYCNLNAALRSEDREQLIPYFLYLKLVLTALWKLKPVKKTIWRGVKADLSEDYPVGKTVVWWGFGSCTESLDLLQSDKFLGKTGVRTLFSIECEHGRSIRSHTYFKKENEILLLPATQLRVEGRIDSGNGLHIIHLVETVPPFPLLQAPHSPPNVQSDCF